MEDDRTVTETAGPAAASASSPAPLLTIVCHPDPAFVGRRCFPGDGATVVIGRNRAAFGEGALDDRRLSRAHAEVVRRGDALRLTDLDSRNGTRVNGEEIRACALAPGDVIGVGRLLLLVHRAPRGFAEPHHDLLVGRSAALGEVLEQVALVAPRPTPVLLLGETGTGKELVARDLHAQSGRSGRFVAVNCGGLADSLLQSELFGHARGAFSGADRARPGLVAEAAGGTLFLDEIGDASPALQVSLLRLLQEREYRPVGADRSCATDVRIVAATHRALGVAVEREAFRQDLFVRLSRWTVLVPPLRDRLDDLPLLARSFAERHAGRPVGLSRELIGALLRAPWPGNVRALDAVLEQIVVETGAADPLPAPAWLADRLAGAAPPPEAPRPPRADASPKPRPTLEALRAHLIDVQGNVKRLAESLGVGRQTAYRWLQEAGIDVEAVRVALRSV